MSFEDDEYWEAEYSDQGLPFADNTAVARDPYAEPRMPHAETPRPPAPPRSQWADDEFGQFDEDEAYDELAARRQRRQTGHSRSPAREKRIQSAFDAERPDWLDDPSFTRGAQASARETFPARETAPPRETTPARAEGRRRRSAVPRVDHVREEDWQGLGERGRPPLEGDRGRPLEGDRSRLPEDDWDSLVEYVDDRREDGRAATAWTDDEDYGGPIRPPGGRRNRRPVAPDLERDPREANQASRHADRTATGRARVPEPSIDEAALDLYRPPREDDGKPGEDRRRGAPARPDEGLRDDRRRDVAERPQRAIGSRSVEGTRDDRNGAQIDGRRDGYRLDDPRRFGPAAFERDGLGPDGPGRDGVERGGLGFDEPRRGEPRRDGVGLSERGRGERRLDERGRGEHGPDERGPDERGRGERGLDELGRDNPGRNGSRRGELGRDGLGRDDRPGPPGQAARWDDERWSEERRVDRRRSEGGRYAEPWEAEEWAAEPWDAEPRRDDRRRDERRDGVIQGELLPPDPRRRGRWNDPQRDDLPREIAWADDQNGRATRRDERFDERDRPEQPARPATERPAAAAASAPDVVRDRKPAPETPGDADSPRVLHKAPPPTTPRVLSKSAPPATPKVIKKADPPVTPRVVSTAPQTAPPRVVPPTPVDPARPGQDGGDPPAQHQAPAASAAPTLPPPAQVDPLGFPPAVPAPRQPDPAQLDRGGPAPRPQTPAAADPRDLPPGFEPHSRPAADQRAMPEPGTPRQVPTPVDPRDMPPADPWATPPADRWAPPAPAAQGQQQPTTQAPWDVPQDPRYRPAPVDPRDGTPQRPRHRPETDEPRGGYAPREMPRPAHQHEMPVGPRDQQPLGDPRARPAASAPVPPAPGAVPEHDPRAMPAAAHLDQPANQPAGAPRLVPGTPGPTSPPQGRPRVEPTPINGYPGGPGTHTVDTPRPEPTRYQQPGQQQPGQQQPGQQQPGQPAPQQPGQPAARHEAAPQAMPAAGPGPTQLTPPAPGDRPSVQTITDLPLLPIGRIATSGPDTAPRKYPDQGLGATWFAPKTPAKPAGPEPAETTTPARQEAAEERPQAARESAKADTDTGLVIDLDLTGLLNGTPATDQQAPAVDAGPTLPIRRSKKPDRQVVPAEGPAAPPAAPPAMPPDGTAAGRAGAAGQEWAARDEAKQSPPVPVEEKPEVRPVKRLAADDLAAIRWRLDGGTLREVVDDRDALRELGGRLDGPLAEEADNVTRAGLLSIRAEVYRLLDELGLAAAASRLALAHAESAGDVQAIVIAQAELAHVLRLRGDFAEADRLFEEAASSEAPEELRSVVHENAGRSCFDQGRHMEALDHFARAVRLGRPDDTDLVERIDVSLEAVYIHALRDGWGPYPRLRREILSQRKA